MMTLHSVISFYVRDNFSQLVYFHVNTLVGFLQWEGQFNRKIMFAQVSVILIFIGGSENMCLIPAREMFQNQNT